MSLNFPADPIANPTYEAPNGVTYIWNDSIQSWVVESITYDNDYVNITGDTMTGNLNFASNRLGLNWGGNPKLVFMTGGETELRGRYAAKGKLTISSSEGINFSNQTSIITYNNSRRLIFTSDYTHISYGGSMYLSVTDKGVQYHGHFTQSKNVTTVEYVTTEIQNVQDQIDNITNDLDDIIEGIIDQKAVLLTGDQTASGTKNFTGNVRITGVKGSSGSSDNYTLSVSRSWNRYFWVTEKGTVHIQTRETFNNTDWPNITQNTQLIHKKYADTNYLRDVIGTSGDTNDTGVRTSKASDVEGTKKIYMEKASMSQYGVNVRGLLPQGNNNPSNSDLKVGQMYFNTNSKRVFIRVN